MTCSRNFNRDYENITKFKDPGYYPIYYTKTKPFIIRLNKDKLRRMKT